MDSNSTILSAYSSRSNSSLSERSKTSPTPLKQIPIQYLPIINQTNLHLPITTDDEVTQLTSFDNYSIDITPKQSPLPSTSEQFQINQNKLIHKRRKTMTNEVCFIFFSGRFFVIEIFRVFNVQQLDLEVLVNVEDERVVVVLNHHRLLHENEKHRLVMNKMNLKPNVQRLIILNI